MKKSTTIGQLRNPIWLLALLFSLSFSMISCGDDDEDETPTDSNELVGKWEGYSLWNEGSYLTIEFSSNGTLSGNENDESFNGSYSMDANLKTYSYKITFDGGDTDEGYDQDYNIDGNSMEIRFDGEDWSMTKVH